MDSAKLPITGPCPIDLDAIGFDRTRASSHCSHCSQNVQVLSNMTRAEAKTFLSQNRGKTMCLSYRRDAQGQIVFKQPAPPSSTVIPLSRLRASGRRASSGRTGATAAAGIALAAALAACTPHDNDTSSKPHVLQVDTKPPVKNDKPLIPWLAPKHEEMPLAGAVAIPEPEMLEGKVALPDEPTDIPDEPRDGKSAR